ncbi:MAG: hypothetical protein H6Q90_4713 [Deltaproteobacteria bacterium]|nr:hypothetical protein [Deltaproteobacteria bacterium]
MIRNLASLLFVAAVTAACVTTDAPGGGVDVLDGKSDAGDILSNRRSLEITKILGDSPERPGAPVTAPVYRLIKSEAQYLEAMGHAPRVEIDFATEWVVLYMPAQLAKWGQSAEITALEVATYRGEESLFVFAEDQRIGAGCLVENVEFRYALVKLAIPRDLADDHAAYAIPSERVVNCTAPLPFAGFLYGKQGAQFGSLRATLDPNGLFQYTPANSDTTLETVLIYPEDVDRARAVLSDPGLFQLFVANATCDVPAETTEVLLLTRPTFSMEHAEDSFSLTACGQPEIGPVPALFEELAAKYFPQP